MTTVVVGVASGCVTRLRQHWALSVLSTSLLYYLVVLSAILATVFTTMDARLGQVWLVRIHGLFRCMH